MHGGTPWNPQGLATRADTLVQPLAPVENTNVSSVNPAISVIVVSDFEASEHKTWKDEIGMAHALAVQDIGIPFEVIFVESDEFRDAPLPKELTALLPEARVIFRPATRSADLKDHGVTLAGSEWVAVLEADCLPEPGWLRLVATAAEQHPAMDVISGRTHYGDSTGYRRVMTLLDRTFNDTGVSREARFVSNNGALYRRSVLLAFPYPDAVNAFLSARRRNIAMHEKGHRFYYQRDALMRHAIGGLGFIVDQHKNYAYMEMKISGRTRLRDIPGMLGRLLWLDLRRYRWLGRLYLRWHDWPLALLMVLVVRVPEALGLYYAVKDVREIPNTAYR